MKQTESGTGNRYELEGVHFVAFQPNGDRAVDEVNGNNQRVVAGNAQQDAFQSLERSVLNSHALANIEVRVGTALYLRVHQGADRFNLLRGNRRCLIVRTYKANDSSDLKNSHARLDRARRSNEDVTWK